MMEMKDVVCGMEVGRSSKWKSIYGGREYLFCSKACKDKFDKEPDKYG
jgi:YHS domain-containing protein